MLDKIKQWFFYNDFKRVLKDKKPSVPVVNSINSICILFDGSSEDDRKAIHRIKKKLNANEKKTIKSLAFINNNLPLDNVDYAAYNLKSIKWYGIPFGEKVDEFINLNFDVLIVLCQKMLPHFEYIIAHSKSAFIIGPNINKAETYFNFILETDNYSDIQNIMDKLVSNLHKVAIKAR